MCDITIASQPTNWQRTNLIDVKDAKILNVQLRYSLFGCPRASSSFCKHAISIYVFHADKELLATDLVLTNTVTYYKVDTIAPRPTDLPAPLQIKIHNCDGKPIIPNARGVYLPCGP